MTDKIHTLTWVDEDGHFYAALSVFPGCIGDGPTLPEAIEDCRKAALEWLDEAKRWGRLQMKSALPGSGNVKQDQDYIEGLAAAARCPRHDAKLRACWYAGGEPCRCREMMELIYAR